MASGSVPRQMKAWTFSKRGQPRDILKLESYPSPPAPTGKKALIKVEYCALNAYSPLLMRLIPSILGSTWTAPEADLVGTVVAAGPNVSAAVKTPGTTVFGMKNMPSVLLEHMGSLAEYVLVDSSLLAPLPEGISKSAASGLGVAACTALQLLQTVEAKSGDRILINGASGGVGSIAVQIAKAMGVHVTGTCSGANAQAVKDFGADEVIDYRTVEPSLTGYLKDAAKNNPFDAILDCVGDQSLYTASPDYLKPKGKLARVGAMGGVLAQMRDMMVNSLIPVFLGGTPRQWIMVNLAPTQDMLQQLAQYVREGKLKINVDSEYKMEDALEAYDRLLSQRARGKIVVKVA